jgi:hypothetical protein
MARWTDPDNPQRNEWCPVQVDTLPTGEGISCGRFATVQAGTDDREVWVCTEHATGKTVCGARYADFKGDHWACVLAPAHPGDHLAQEGDRWCWYSRHAVLRQGSASN